MPLFALRVNTERLPAPHEGVFFCRGLQKHHVFVRRHASLHVMSVINSEGFLAEVFHPWVRWEGPGSGFENSSGAGAGGAWKSKWVGPGYTDLAPLGLRSKNKVFERPG